MEEGLGVLTAFIPYDDGDVQFNPVLYSAYVRGVHTGAGIFVRRSFAWRGDCGSRGGGGGGGKWVSENSVVGFAHRTSYVGHRRAVPWTRSTTLHGRPGYELLHTSVQLHLPRQCPVGYRTVGQISPIVPVRCTQWDRVISDAASRAGADGDGSSSGRRRRRRRRCEARGAAARDRRAISRFTVPAQR